MLGSSDRLGRRGESPRPARARPRRTRFRSKLPDPVGRFASELIEDGLARGIRTPQEFLAVFPASRIARCLEKAPDVRTSILEIGLGMSRHEAELEPPTVFSITLERALQRRELDAETLVQLIRPDDRVLYLHRPALWNYIKGERLWWEKARDGGVSTRARDNTALIVDLALLHGLVGPEDVSPGGMATRLVEHLPRRRVAAILRTLLQRGDAPRSDSPTDGPALSALLDLVPIDLVWRVLLEPHLESIFLNGPVGPAVPRIEASPAGVPSRAMDCDGFVELPAQRPVRRRPRRPAAREAPAPAPEAPPAP